MATSLPPIDGENAFRAWLRDYHHHADRLVRNTIARCRRINRDLGNIRAAYEADGCARMLAQLTYTVEDAHNHRPAPGNLIFSGDVKSERYYTKTLREGLATLRKELEIYCEFRGRGSVLPVKTDPVPTGGGKAASVRTSFVLSSPCVDLCDFKGLLTQWHGWLIESEDLTKNSADQYKTYIRKLATAVDSVFGCGWFESLAEEVKDVSSGKLKNCSAFIENEIRNATKKNKKAWNDWRSAFHSFEEFLFDITNSWLGEGDKTTHVRAIAKKQTPKTDETPPKKVIRQKRAARVDPGATEAVSFYSHKDLVRMFMNRLKTQGRYYPAHKLLFPTRTLTKIFHGQKGNAWQAWLKSGIEKMRVWISPNESVAISDVNDLVILANGSVHITCKKGIAHEVWTKTADDNMKPECAKNGSRDLSIDHAVSLEKTIRKVKGQLHGLKRLTEMFAAFKREIGVKLDERREYIWVNDFFARYAAILRTDNMRSLLEQDLKLLDFQYELMDTVENSKKNNSR